MKPYKGAYNPALDVLHKAYLDEKDPAEKARLKRIWRGAKHKEMMARQRASQETE